ncbi:MAG: hypothetical protein ACTHKR_06055, partial [Sphingomonas sp.]
MPCAVSMVRRNRELTMDQIIVCGACRALNKVPAARLADAPKCAKCGMPLLTGKPAAADQQLFDRLI